MMLYGENKSNNDKHRRMNFDFMYCDFDFEFHSEKFVMKLIPICLGKSYLLDNFGGILVELSSFRTLSISSA